MKKHTRKLSLHRETVRALDLTAERLREINAAASSLCTIGHPHCDTLKPCIFSEACA